MADKPPSPRIDRERFGYVLKARLDDEGMSLRDVETLTGVPIALTSRALRGVTINAGAVHVLAVAFGIDLDGMLPRAVADRLARIRQWRESRAAKENTVADQTVPLPVSRETLAEMV